MSTTEIARLWGHDRQALGVCDDRHASLSKAVRAIEGQAEKEPPE